MTVVRERVPGGIVHVFAKAVDGTMLFRDGVDWAFAIVSMANVLKKFPGVDCLGWVFLGTHYHLLLRSQSGDLAPVMQSYNLRLALALNRRYGRRGRAFDGPYGDVAITSTDHLLVAARYVYRNAELAGLCDDPLKWPWSSYAATVNAAPRPSFLTVAPLLEAIHRDEARAIEILDDFVRVPDPLRMVAPLPPAPVVVARRLP
jgi:hypothetical protein